MILPILIIKGAFVNSGISIVLFVSESCCGCIWQLGNGSSVGDLLSSCFRDVHSVDRTGALLSLRAMPACSRLPKKKTLCLFTAKQVQVHFHVLAFD